MIAEKLLKAEKEKRAVYGAKQALALLRSMGADEVFVSSDFAHTAEAERLAAISSAKFTKLSLTSEELSSQLKKQFNIAAAAVKKGK
ncbi:MAG: hypothetical protein HYT16_00550 [DPANN group archaeon]|nr:hypothetical protein [DPANN group archaeon]